MARREPESSESTGPTPGLIRFLYATAAINGAAILVVEILGAKMLSPFMGTSHFVWTAQIGVTLIALAAGYYLGGRWVDASPNLANLYYAVLAAAVYLCATIPLVKPVCFACLNMNLAVGSLLASAFLFLVPLALLAMTLPFLTRVLTQTVDEVGGNVGRLSAISTIGSVAGTSLIGYVLIPNVHNSVTMLATAAVLILLATAYLLTWGRKPVGGLLVGVLTISSLFGFAGWVRTMKPLASNYRVQFANGSSMAVPQRQLARENSNFGELLVVERDFPVEMLSGTNAVNYATRHNTAILKRRIYLNDLLTQNEYDPVERKSLNLFTEMLHGLARAYTPDLNSALCIGMGVGIVPMRLAEEKVEVDVAEINPVIVPLAEKWFDFDRRAIRRLHLEDGRLVLNKARQTGEKWDTIILDAFLGESSPSHLMTTGAFQTVADCLTDDGTLIINSFGRDVGEAAAMDPASRVFNQSRDFLTVSLYRTLRTITDFKDVRIHAAGGGNVFFVVAKRKLPAAVPAFDFSDSHVYLREHYDTRSRPSAAMERTWTVDPAMGMVLTDDFNPVEIRDAVNRESLRRDLAKRLQ
tara:strand:+ start:144 stop:1889 length:1746 start_codon:yes stop_codon:yes gene_type:complete